MNSRVTNPSPRHRPGRRWECPGREAALLAVLACAAAAWPGDARAQTTVDSAPATYVEYNNLLRQFSVDAPTMNSSNAFNKYARVTTSDGQQINSTVLIPVPGVPGVTQPVAVAPAGVANDSLGGLFAAWPGQNEDVLMQQCYAGAFAWNMQGSVAKAADKGYTFTSAARYNELAWNSGIPSPSSPPADLTSYKNFTSSWVASFPRPEGAYMHYVDATKGADAIRLKGTLYPAVPQDPFTNGGSRYNLDKLSFENPVYASSDSLTAAGKVDLTGPNNSRQIMGNANQFAVLVAFSPDRAGFAADIERVYAQLIDRGVPAKNIAVLYGNMARGILPAFPGLGLPAGVNVLNDEPVTLANLRNLLAGNAAAWRKFDGNVPNANSNLFFYSTGHGAGFNPFGTKLEPANPTAGPGANAANALFSMQYVDDPYSRPMTTLQVSTRTPISAAQLASDQVSIDGIAVGTLSPATPTAVDSVSEYVGSTYTYDLRFASIDDTSIPGLVQIDIKGLLSGLDSLQSNTVVAMTLDDGDSTYITTIQSVPEPSGYIPLGTGLLAALGYSRRRRPRAHLGCPQ